MCQIDHPIEPGTINATWTHDGEVLVGFRRISSYRHSTARDITWDLAASPPTRHEEGDDGGVFSWIHDDEFEAEGLFLIGPQFDLLQPSDGDRGSPTAADRRTRMHSIWTNSDRSPPTETIRDITYTYAPTTVPTDGTRVRTGSDGETFEFRYEGGHLVVGESYSYTWSGDRLTRMVPTGEQDEVEYVYDEHGNLTEKRDSGVTTFDYACWK